MGGHGPEREALAAPAPGAVPAPHGTAWHRMARLAWHGWHGTARNGVARLAWHGMPVGRLRQVRVPVPVPGAARTSRSSKLMDRAPRRQVAPGAPPAVPAGAPPAGIHRAGQGPRRCRRTRERAWPGVVPRWRANSPAQPSALESIPCTAARPVLRPLAPNLHDGAIVAPQQPDTGAVPPDHGPTPCPVAPRWRQATLRHLPAAPAGRLPPAEGGEPDTKPSPDSPRVSCRAHRAADGLRQTASCRAAAKAAARGRCRCRCRARVPPMRREPPGQPRQGAHLLIRTEPPNQLPQGAHLVIRTEPPGPRQGTGLLTG